MTQPQQSSTQSQSWPILLTLFEANLKKIVLSIIENHTANYLICKLLNNLKIIIDPKSTEHNWLTYLVHLLI